MLYRYITEHLQEYVYDLVFHEDANRVTVLTPTGVFDVYMEDVRVWAR